jgi:hypothetical protein
MSVRRQHPAISSPITVLPSGRVELGVMGRFGGGAASPLMSHEVGDTNSHDISMPSISMDDGWARAPTAPSYDDQSPNCIRPPLPYRPTGPVHQPRAAVAALLAHPVFMQPIRRRFRAPGRAYTAYHRFGHMIARTELEDEFSA